MPTTTNYGWTTPADTDLVKDGAAAIRTLGSSIDTTVFNNANAAIAKTIVDAKGDIIAATAADTVSRLAVGANDTVLMADSSTATGLKWGTVSSGGMTLITTTTFDNTANSYTYSSLGSYKHLLIVIDNVTSAATTNISNINFRFNGDTGTNYHSVAFGNSDNGLDTGSITDGTFCLGFFRGLANNTTTDPGYRSFGNAWIYDYAGSTYKTFTTWSGTIYNAGITRSMTCQNIWESTSAITSLTVLTQNTNNFNTGTLKLYGVS